MSDKKTIDTPFEELFDIEPGTTEAVIQPPAIKDIDSPEMEDEEDKHVSKQLETVYEYAIESYEQQTNTVQSIDPKFAARNAEVAAQYLKIALDAADTRAKNKNSRKKINAALLKAGTPDTLNQNLIVTNRNELFDMVEKMEQSQNNIKDVTPIENEDD